MKMVIAGMVMSMSSMLREKKSAELADVELALQVLEWF